MLRVGDKVRVKPSYRTDFNYDMHIKCIHAYGIDVITKCGAVYTFCAWQLEKAD